jgi:hypothetical protein
MNKMMSIIKSIERKDTPHILVTIQFTGTNHTTVVRCWDMIYNAENFALFSDEGELVFLSSRRISDVVSVQPIE